MKKSIKKVSFSKFEQNRIGKKLASQIKGGQKGNSGSFSDGGIGEEFF